MADYPALMVMPPVLLADRTARTETAVNRAGLYVRPISLPPAERMAVAAAAINRAGLTSTPTGTAAATTIWFLMRGRNTGSGPAWVYWTAPDEPDPTGAHYTGPVPFGQLADIIAASSFN